MISGLSTRNKQWSGIGKGLSLTAIVQTYSIHFLFKATKDWVGIEVPTLGVICRILSNPSAGEQPQMDGGAESDFRRRLF